MSDYKLLIDGKLVSGAMALNVVNPATEEVVVVAPRADRAQLEQAVAAAKAAFPRWSLTPVRDRGALLARLADAVEARQAEFAEILTAENGKPIAQAVLEMEAVVAAMRSLFWSRYAPWRPSEPGPRSRTTSCGSVCSRICRAFMPATPARARWKPHVWRSRISAAMCWESPSS
jgi:Aldehyde dehydrogenase family